MYINIFGNCCDRNIPRAEAEPKPNTESTPELTLQIEESIKDSTLTNFFEACRSGNLEMVQSLLESKKVDVNSIGENTCKLKDPRAIHIAVEYGHEEIVQVLLKNGANVNSMTENGYTSLHLAAKFGRDKIVKLLLKNSAFKDVQCVCEGSDYHCTALHFAARSKSKKTVEVLLEYKVGVNVVNKTKNTPLHYATEFEEEEQKEMVEVLLNNGADVTMKNQRKIGEEFIEDKTPLHLAALRGYYQIAKAILAKNSDITATDTMGNTSLHLAVLEKRVEIAVMLLLRKTDVNVCNRFKNTPLHFATLKEHKTLVEILLVSGANPNAVNIVEAEDGSLVPNETPLFWAIRSGKEEIITMLLKFGAYTNIENAEGKTLKDLAKLKNIDLDSLKKA